MRDWTRLLASLAAAAFCVFSLLVCSTAASASLTACKVPAQCQLDGFIYSHAQSHMLTKTHVKADRVLSALHTIVGL